MVPRSYFQVSSIVTALLYLWCLSHELLLRKCYFVVSYSNSKALLLVV